MIFKYLNADYYHAKFKEKLIVEFLKSIPDGKSILDVGAGEMPYRKYCEHLRYKSQDFCQYDGKGDSRGIQTQKFDTGGIDIVSDITEIPLPDGSEANMLCAEVLEHVENPLDAIRELRRILRPGGRILITVPGTSLLHFSPYHYYTGFKTNFFKSALEKERFNVDKIVRVGSIYTVTALYLWFMAERFSRVLFPWRSSVLFKLLILGFSPFIFLLIALDRIRILDSEILEAGLLVIGTKRA